MVLLAGLAAAFPTPDGRPEAVGFADSAVFPIRCHYERDTDAARCGEVLVWAEEAWAAQIEEIGFRPPVNDTGGGGSDALDLYLSREAGGAGSAWVQCSEGYYACSDADPTDEYLGTASFVIIDPRTGDDLFRSYVHHEFNHTLQYGYDFSEPFLSVWEGTAAAAEHWTDPSWPTLVRDFVDYQETPWVSAVLQDGYQLYYDYDLWSYYEYGAVTWVFWMDEQYGDGNGSIGPAIWEALAQPDLVNEPDVLDAWEAISGDWRLSMLAFAADRATLGTDAAPAWATFAGPEAAPLREAVLTLPAIDVVPVFPPFPLGTSYFDVAVEAGDTLEVAVASDTDTTWGLTVGADTFLDATATWTAAAAGTVTIGVVNLGPPEMDADDPLLPASFALTVTLEQTPREPEGGCGCHSATAGRGSWVLAALFALRRRRTPRGSETNRSAGATHVR